MMLAMLAFITRAQRLLAGPWGIRSRTLMRSFFISNSGKRPRCTLRQVVLGRQLLRSRARRYAGLKKTAAISSIAAALFRQPKLLLCGVAHFFPRFAHVFA